DAHSHGFQRALRGRAGGTDFWEWRELMLAEAERQTPALVRREYVQVYRELRAAGYTAVGEFHYLGFDEALAAVDAAAEAGIRIVILLAAYGRGGLPRFRQESVNEYLKQVEDLRGRGILVGVAPHSVRACPADWLEEMRELEGISRRQAGRRNVISTETLLCFGADEGAGSLGLEQWDDVEVDLSHTSLRGVEDVFEALVSGCGADVFLEA